MRRPSTAALRLACAVGLVVLGSAPVTAAAGSTPVAAITRPAAVPLPAAAADQTGGSCDALALARPDLSGYPDVGTTATVPLSVARDPLPAGAFTASQSGRAVPVVTTPTRETNLAVVLVLDSSRLTPAAAMRAAQGAALEFLLDLPGGARVGVVTATGSPQVALAPTTDHDAVAGAIGALRPGDGRDLSGATALALHQVSGLPGPRSVVVLSGGASTAGSASHGRLGMAATVADAPVDVISYGDRTVTLPGIADCSERVTPALLVGALDSVAAQLVNRYQLTVRTSQGRADVQVALRAGAVGRQASLSLGGPSSGPDARAAASATNQPGGSGGVLWLRVGAIAIVVVGLVLIGTDTGRRVLRHRSIGRHRRRA